MTTRRSLPIDQYQVGVICALRHEMTAAIAMLDERHQPITGQDKLDPNNYVLGRVHKHNVVIACLPAGIYGTNAAARVANDMLRTFTGLRFGLMVGIGGGIPNLVKGLDIRLGDIVVSQPDKTFGGVVQYDLRKNLGGEQYERKGFLKSPPTMLLGALSTLQAEHDLEDSKVPSILADMVKKHPNLVKNGYGFPGQEQDILSCPRCDGSESSDPCNWCVDGQIERSARKEHHPVLWYGVIASGNELMKNAAERDRIGEEFGALCVEMEAAGLMNDFPCIIIRGICDYADAHKNDGWQKYAAVVAAAYAKEFLGYISPERTRLEKPIQDIVGK
jgi:nucleoside phosphorylase